MEQRESMHHLPHHHLQLIPLKVHRVNPVLVRVPQPNNNRVNFQLVEQQLQHMGVLIITIYQEEEQEEEEQVVSMVNSPFLSLSMKI